MPGMNAMRAFDAITIGDELPGREHQPDLIQLFLFNAVIWNPHRIHYDAEYATQAEGYSGVVVDGPLQADWLSQILVEWAGPEAQLLSFAYTNRRAAFLGETLQTGGSVTAKDPESRTVTVELHVRNDKGDVTTPARGVVRFAKPDVPGLSREQQNRTA